MTVALLDDRARLALGALAVVALLVALLLGRRGLRSATTAVLCLALTAAGALIAEGLVALTVRWHAPHTADFNEHRWVLLAPWRRLGLWLGGSVVAAIALLAWRASRGVSPWRRAPLIVLRVAAALTALVVFLEPAVELRQVAREPNRVALVIDDSRSMALRDLPRGPTRTERTRAMLDASADAFASWRRLHQLDVYTFSDVLAATSLEAVARTEPRGDATLNRKALEAVRARYDGRDLAGVVQVSDGAATGDLDDKGDGTIRDFLRSLDTRIHTATPVRPGLRDVAVRQVLADEFAFVRTVVRIEAVPSNNSRAFVLRVIRDKIRVLQVAGAPSWDVRATRAMLEDNPNVDLISFFILRTQDDISLVPSDEMSLIPFPTRELFEQQLPSFDVIIMQNFEFLPYGIGDYLENIRAYVDGGGGLAMLGGAMSFSSGGYYGTPVARALPVDLLDPYARALVDTTEFAPTLTEAGKSHPVTALRYAIADNLAAWKALPPLEGVNLVLGAKADATVLAVHPRLRTNAGAPMPVIVTGEHGKGRSLAVTTDSLWRFGFVAAARPGDDGRQYTRLWENAIRWLIQDPDLRNLHVDTDAVEYVPGAAVRVNLRLLGRDYQPLPAGKVTLRWRLGANPAAAVPVGATEVTVGDDGTGSFELQGLVPGAYRVEATATVAGMEVAAGDIFLVRDATAELDEPTGDLVRLAAIAAGSGGRALGPVDALPADLGFDPPRVVRVDRRADVELWSRPLLIVLLLLLLGSEWLLRQRSGYL